jgi:hypothetical protein
LAPRRALDSVTAASVGSLQNAKRRSIIMSVLIGSSIGAFVSLAVSLGVGLGVVIPMAMPFIPGLVVVIACMVSGPTFGALLGALLARRRDARPDWIRSHGLHALGIVASRSQSAKIVRAIGRHVDADASDSALRATVEAAVASKHMSLTSQQVASIVAYYQFAAQNLRTVGKSVPKTARGHKDRHVLPLLASQNAMLQSQMVLNMT